MILAGLFILSLLFVTWVNKSRNLEAKERMGRVVTPYDTLEAFPADSIPKEVSRLCGKRGVVREAQGRWKCK